MLQHHAIHRAMTVKWLVRAMSIVALCESSQQGGGGGFTPR